MIFGIKCDDANGEPRSEVVAFFANDSGMLYDNFLCALERLKRAIGLAGNLSSMKVLMVGRERRISPGPIKWVDGGYVTSFDSAYRYFRNTLEGAGVAMWGTPSRETDADWEVAVRFAADNSVDFIGAYMGRFDVMDTEDDSDDGADPFSDSPEVGQ